MAKEEIQSKIVSINGTIKTKVVDGERRIVFVASSANVDRHYEQVNVSSLRLPLKGGGDITVEAIPAEGVTDIVDIPLMLNHSGDVRDVIGSVRSAFFENGELIFEAGISSREVAQEMLTLIEEGHLSNAFSITMTDFDYNFESETISNAEIIEVSLVYRGSNKEARLLAIKSLMEGNKMSEAEKQNDTFGDANGDGKDHSQKPADTPKEEAPVETPETPETPVEEPKNEETQTEENTDEPTEQEPTEEKEAETPNEEKKAMSKQIAKDTVVEKATQPVQSSKSADYLSTKAALVDFKDTVLKFHRGSNQDIMKAWMENLKEKAITGDAILPSRIEQIFFKTWQDNPGILGTFRFLNVRAGAVYAMTTSDTAKGHVKGATKSNQTLTSIRRDLKALGIYKRLPIDLQDLFDDETGELLAFRAEELADRVGNQIAVAALIGGEGSVGTPAGNTRGINPMLADINATTGYGSHVAVKIAPAASDTEYEIAVKAGGAVKDNGAGKILVVPTGFTTNLRLAKNENGGVLFPAGTDFAAALGFKAIYELDEITGTTKAIAYADQSYVLCGEANATVRTDFDTTNNQDIMLVERYVAGSATGYKTVAGVIGS